MMMPLYYDLARFQAIEFNDQIRKSAYSFQLVNDRLRLYPIPDGSNFTKVYFDYIKKSDRSNALKGATGTISDFTVSARGFLLNLNFFLNMVLLFCYRLEKHRLNSFYANRIPDIARYASDFCI